MVDAGRWGDDVGFPIWSRNSLVRFAATVPPAILDIDAMAPNITDYRLGFPDVHCIRYPFTFLPQASANRDRAVSLSLYLNASARLACSGSFSLSVTLNAPALLGLWFLAAPLRSSLLKRSFQIVTRGFVDALEKIVGGGAGIMLGVALLPVLTSPDGLFSRINQQQWFRPKAVDSETRELVIGLFAIALFALALVAFQHLD